MTNDWEQKFASLLSHIEEQGWDISDWWDEHMVNRDGITIGLGKDGYSVKPLRLPEPQYITVMPIDWQPAGCGEPETSGVRVHYHLLSEEDDYALCHSQSFNEWLQEMVDGESKDGIYAEFDNLDAAGDFLFTLERNEISHLIVEA